MTTDVKRRFFEHKHGKGAKYTKSHKPAKVEFVLEFNSKCDALKVEYRIKQCTKLKKESLIDGTADIHSLHNDLVKISATSIDIDKIFSEKENDL